MKKLLYLVLVAFTVGLFLPEIQADPTQPVAAAKAKQKKKKKKKKHRKRHKKPTKHRKVAGVLAVLTTPAVT